MTGKDRRFARAPDPLAKNGSTLDRGCLDDLVGHLLRHAFLRGHQVFANVFDGDDITPLQFMALELVSCNPGITHRDMASALSCAPSVLTTALKPVVAAGALVRDAVDTDRRRTAYRLSASGAERFARLRPKIGLAEADLLSALTCQEQELLRDILLRIVGRQRL